MESAFAVILDAKEVLRNPKNDKRVLVDLYVMTIRVKI